MAELKASQVSSPHDLQDTKISIMLSELNLKVPAASSQSASHAKQTRLVLLQPLADAETLAACHNPESRKLYRSDGLFCGTTDNEYLNIQPLGLAWRKALMGVSPISDLVFDLTLPRVENHVEEVDNGKDAEDSAGVGKPSSQRIYWDTSLPKDGGIAVNARDVMTVVITIATTTKMRCQGDVQFDVVYDELDKPSLKAMSALKKQLLGLSRSKSVEQGDEGHGKEEDGK